jgi:drug/metabolite transporter (DMT)-like permease
MVIAIYLCVILSSVTQSAGAKLFNRHSSDAMLFNAVKALSALLLFALMAAFGFTLHLPTVLYGALYGVSLSLSMFAGYKALCLGPMALTSMLCSFSVILPLIWGLAVWNEKLKPLQIAALFLLFCAIVLINVGKRAQPKEEKTNHKLWLLFVGATFLCNGLCSILQKQHQSLYPGLYSREFMLFAMLLCSVAFSLLALAGGAAKRLRQTRGKRYGILAGVANGLASLFTLILAGFENASVLFPLISAGTILGAMACGRLFFHERLRLNHYFALALGILAAVFLKL